MQKKKQKQKQKKTLTCLVKRIILINVGNYISFIIHRANDYGTQIKLQISIIRQCIPDWANGCALFTMEEQFPP